MTQTESNPVPDGDDDLLAMLKERMQGPLAEARAQFVAMFRAELSEEKAAECEQRLDEMLAAFVAGQCAELDAVMVKLAAAADMLASAVELQQENERFRREHPSDN